MVFPGPFSGGRTQAGGEGGRRRLRHKGRRSLGFPSLHLGYRHAGPVGGRRKEGRRRHVSSAGTQCLAHDEGDGIRDAPLIRKANLSLVGMHVDIHRLIGQCQVQHAQGKAADHYPLTAAFFHSLRQKVASHCAAVDKKLLVASVAA